MIHFDEGSQCASEDFYDALEELIDETDPRGLTREQVRNAILMTMLTLMPVAGRC